jgi:hypothetical protein
LQKIDGLGNWLNGPAQSAEEPGRLDSKTAAGELWFRGRRYPFK